MLTTLHARPVFFVVGVFLLILSAAMLVPASLDLWYAHANVQNFMGSCFVSAFLGGICILAYRGEDGIQLRVRETFFLTVCTWVLISFFAALPFVLSRTVDSFTDGFLEAVSAFTTTGISLLKKTDTLPPSLLLWRSLLQWLGGLGIMMMALTLLPFLRIGGMQLFYTEFSDRSEKILPKLSQITQAILVVYLFLTVSCCALLCMEGIPFFDAICLSMGTVSTGGLSAASGGVNYLDSGSVRLILSVFMILAASPLLLFVRLFSGDWSAYLEDTQVRAYLLWIGISILVIVFWLWQSESETFESSLTRGIFSVSNTFSTTGFQVQENWPAALHLFFLWACVVGGCTGSTAGGIKIFRFQILYRMMKAQMYQLLRPHGVFIPVYAKRNVEEHVISAVFSFVAIYLLSCAVLSTGFAICGVSEGGSFYLSVNILSNSGMYPVAFDSLTYPSLAKWLAIFGMFLGRLEFFTVLIVLIRAFWRS